MLMRIHWYRSTRYLVLVTEKRYKIQKRDSGPALIRNSERPQFCGRGGEERSGSLVAGSCARCPLVLRCFVLQSAVLEEAMEIDKSYRERRVQLNSRFSAEETAMPQQKP